MAGPSQPSGGMITGINVTPLVDITLVLLIIFMVTAKIMVTPALPMDLPKASQGEAVQVVLSVIIPKVGTTLINGIAVVDDASMIQFAKDAVLRDPELRAVIHADGDVSHRRVVHVLDLLKRAGLSRIAFATAPADSGLEATP